MIEVILAVFGFFAAWFAGGVVVGMIIGGVIRNRDTESPGVQNVPTQEETESSSVSGAKVLHVPSRSETCTKQV